MVATMDASVGQGALSGAGTGIATGASIGAVGGPVGIAIGAAIGGVVGALGGGAGGFLSGKKKKKAKKYARMANNIQRQREEEAYKQNLLAQIRQARIARSSMLATTVAAGAEEGSGSQGALSSFGSQLGNVVEYLSVDRGRAVQSAYYSSRANKNAETAAAIGQTTTGFINLGAAVAKAGAAYYNTPTEADTKTYGNPFSPNQYGSNYDPETMLPPIKPDFK